jgi:hypothetical protein
LFPYLLVILVCGQVLAVVAAFHENEIVSLVLSFISIYRLGAILTVLMRRILTTFVVADVEAAEERTAIVLSNWAVLDLFMADDTNVFIS